MRTFDTGAMRDSDDVKIDPEGYLSPLALEAYFNFMRRHQVCADGSIRSSSNWKKGIPVEAYMKSMWRHFFTVWQKYTNGEDPTEDLTALFFNVQGMLHETIKTKGADK